MEHGVMGSKCGRRTYAIGAEDVVKGMQRGVEQGANQDRMRVERVANGELQR
jgi:hypothetical protein